MPYDAEIEYLYNNGSTQCMIDTLVESSPKNAFWIRFKTTNTNGISQGLIAYRSVQTVTKNELNLWYSGINIALNTNGADSGWFSCSPNVIHNASVDNDLSGNISLVLDDVVLTTRQCAEYTSSGTLGLFKSKVGSSADGWDTRYVPKTYIYACKIWQNGNLVRDFIPVRVGTTGYMYDRVSGTLFGNAGTDSFTLGNDK